MNVVQGKNAILYFQKKGQYVPFVCASDFGIAIQVDNISVRTAGDGSWKKYAAQKIGYAINLSGVLVWGDDNSFDTWDVVVNMINFLQIPFRAVYKDDSSTPNIKTAQGVALVKQSSLLMSMGQVTKGEFAFDGTGALFIFDGLLPCPTSIDSIVTTGIADAMNQIEIDYTYTGDVYQVKYRIDGVGDYAYALAGPSMTIQAPSPGNHSIEIIPVCQNNFEGSGRSVDFVAKVVGVVCNTTITDITIDLVALTATPVYSGTATQMQYSIDGGTKITQLITQPISLKSVAAGNHDIFIQAMCVSGANLIPGGSLDKNFTIAVQPATAKISYSFTKTFGTGSLSVYVNGILTIGIGSTFAGTLNAPMGSTIRAVVSGTIPLGGFTGLEELEIQKSGTTISDQVGVIVGPSKSLTYTFTADQSNVYSIIATLSENI